MNCKEQNGAWPSPQLGAQWVFKELCISLARTATGIFSLSAEDEPQAQDFVKLQEHSFWTDDSLIQPLLSCFSLSALAWLSSYFTFSTSGYPEIACKIVK